MVSTGVVKGEGMRQTRNKDALGDMRRIQLGKYLNLLLYVLNLVLGAF